MGNVTDGRSLELFFVDGKPDGMLTAEVFNWTGHVLYCPRTNISAALARKESKHTGVYILLGDKDDEPCEYIGEAEEIDVRLKQQVSGRDWWTSVAIITSSANSLNKAHVKYLESRLVEEAIKIGQIKLENSNVPPRSSLSESARSNMESFLSYLLMVLPAIRIDMFVQRKRPTGVQALQASTADIKSPVATFELKSRKGEYDATAILQDGEFTVQSGSIARNDWIGAQNHNYAKLYHDLVRQEILNDNDGKRVFTSSFVFNSPSAAAAIVTGRSANGLMEWKLSGSKKTYQQWESEQVNFVVDLGTF
jgi:Domain of unknown function (DUF4357)